MFCSETNSNQICQRMENQSCDVIIVGAGISGLAAGKLLLSRRINFIILEGGGRVGGRVNTTEMVDLGEKNNSQSILIDAGAQWIHGRNNELFEIATELQIIHPELSEEAEGEYISDDGERLNDFFVKKVDFEFGKILEECEEFVKEKRAKSVQFPTSMNAFVQDKFEKFIHTLESPDEIAKAKQLLDWHQRFVSGLTLIIMRFLLIEF